MKILVAEDDPITRMVIADNLVDWGYKPVLAEDGLIAWAELQKPDSPKLALIDWQMPNITGFEICQRLRARSSGAYVYVIMLTSLSDKMHVVKGLEAGADDYLVKPYNPYELRIRLLNGKRFLAMETELLSALKQVQKYAALCQHARLLGNSELIDRELEILTLMAAGKSNEQIASAFHLSPDWVASHINNMMSKVNVHSREALLEKATQEV